MKNWELFLAFYVCNFAKSEPISTIFAPNRPLRARKATFIRRTFIYPPNIYPPNIMRSPVTAARTPPRRRRRRAPEVTLTPEDLENVKKKVKVSLKAQHRKSTLKNYAGYLPPIFQWYMKITRGSVINGAVWIEKNSGGIFLRPPA